jgi:CBS domain-containing protein
MGLVENLHNERVSQLPLRPAVAVDPDCPVLTAIEQMRAAQQGCAVVVDPQGKPLGTFSERMVIELLLRHPANLENLSVGDHLDAEWFCVRHDDPLIKVLELIQQQGARFLCVTNDEGGVVALTGQKGLTEYVAEHFPQQVMVQRIGGQPGQQTREGA